VYTYIFFSLRKDPQPWGEGYTKIGQNEPERSDKMSTTADVLEKLRGWDGPTMLALVDAAGGRENLEAVLRGEKKMTFEDVIRKLVDKNGRLIPAKELKCNVCDPNKKFNLIQPQVDCAQRLNRFVQFLPGMQFPSVAEFDLHVRALIGQLKNDSLLSNLLNGVYLPVCFPKLEISDYGKSLEEIFIAAAEKSYKVQFPERSFNNYRKGELAGKVGIVEGSRHEKLLAKMVEGPVVGIIFFPMQGFSIDASREQMSVLPESLLLSGSIDITTAAAMYPDVIGREYNTPGYLCSANTWQSAEYSLYAKADDDDFSFSNADYLAGADDYYSSGLFFIG
jgi:hypothetical protein